MITKRLRRWLLCLVEFSEKKESEILKPRKLYFIEWESHVFLNFINLISVKFRNACKYCSFFPASSKKPSEPSAVSLP